MAILGQYPFSEHRPDCRVFVKRLVTPDPEITKNIKMGTSHMDAVSGFGMPYSIGAFHNYYPQGKFYKELLDKYRKDYLALTTKISEEIKKKNWSIDLLKKEIADLESQIKNIGSDNQKGRELTEKLTQDNEELKFETAELSSLKKSYSTVRPTYEPCLLEIITGVVNVNTNIVRSGIGTASVIIKLPLEENGFYENVLYAIKNVEMFNADKMTAGSMTAQQMKDSTAVSARELNIFKIVRDSDGNTLYVDRRECSLLPHDMIQIYFTKRYLSGTMADNANKTTVGIPVFPKDYIPGFTGFIKNTVVSFTGGQNPSYTITIDCEDIAHVLRMSRANVDPSVDPRYRLEGLTVTAYQSKLQVYGDEIATGADIIESLIRGRDGYWWGVSQIEAVDDVAYDGDSKQYTFVRAKQTEETNAQTGSISSRGVRVVSMPWEFDHIPFNSYKDLITSEVWRPYVAAFKSSFRLWESDYKYRWDICKEISDIMEFELYADSFGSINYHPPFYNLNPSNIKYFIEDKEILSEQHKFSEANVVTAVEVVSQPQLGTPDNIAKILSAFATADDELIQRYGMRFRTKNIPVLSGTDRALQAEPGLIHETRYLFARAWLNRRNLEVQSATVEIPGTPEYFVCNPIAFVGNFGELLAKLAYSTVKSTIANSTSSVLNINAATSFKEISTSAMVEKLINSIRVYYISGVSHRYSQGGSFTTTLTLTHGRLWGNHFNVGYAFTADENNQLLQNFKKLSLNRKDDDKTMLKKMAVNAMSKTYSRDLNLISPVVANVRPALDAIEVPKVDNINTATGILAKSMGDATKISTGV